MKTFLSFNLQLFIFIIEIGFEIAFQKIYDAATKTMHLIVNKYLVLASRYTTHYGIKLTRFRF